MFTYIGSLFIIVWELMCCKLLIEIFAEKRHYCQKALSFILYGGTIVVEYIATGLLQDILWLKIVVVLIGLATTMYILFNASIFKLIMIVMLFQGLNVLSDYAVLLLLAKFFPQLSQYIMTEDIGIYLISIISKIVLLFVILIIRRKVRKKTEDMLTDIEWLGLLVIPLITILSIVAIALQYNVFSGDMQDDVLLYVALGMAVMNFMVFFLLETVFKRERIIREKQIMNETMKKEMELYYSISENLDSQRQMTHEFKNYITCIVELLRNKDYTELEEYVANLNYTLTEGIDMVDTNNIIINAILNTKYREALEKGILMILKVGDLSELQLKDMDVVTILANLLSNAIEACEKCEEKMIKFKFVIEDGAAIITVKNTMEKNPWKMKNIFVTTKTQERELHGYGVKNIIEIVERYNGKYLIDYDEGMFNFTIVI